MGNLKKTIRKTLKGRVNLLLHQDGPLLLSNRRAVRHWKSNMPPTLHLLLMDLYRKRTSLCLYHFRWGRTGERVCLSWVVSMAQKENVANSVWVSIFSLGVLGDFFFGRNC